MNIIILLGLILEFPGFPPPNIAVKRMNKPSLYPSMDVNTRGEPFIAFDYAIEPHNHDVVIYRWEDRKNWKAAWTKTGGYWFENDSVDHRQPALGIDTHDRIYLLCKGRANGGIGGKWFWLRSDDYGNKWKATTGIDGTEWYGTQGVEPVISICKEGLDVAWLICQRNEGGDSDIECVYETDREFVEHAAIASSDKERRPWVAAGFGYSVIAYEYYNGSDWDVYAESRLNVGPHIPPPLVASSPVGFEPGVDELQPYVATRYDYFCCAYTREDDVWLGYSEEGEFFDITPIATSKEKESRPAVAFDGEKAYVAYYHGSGNIYLRGYNAFTQTLGPVCRITDRPTALDTPRVVMCLDSLLYIAWVDNRNGNPDIYVAQVSPGIVPMSIEQEASENRPRLLRTYPNPFKRDITIEYSIAQPSQALLEIYNSIGERIRGFAKEEEVPGIYRVEWDGKDFRGFDAPAGIYFVKLQASKGVETRQIVLIR